MLGPSISHPVKIMVITVAQTRNRFFRFLDDKTSVPHNEIRYTTKFSPKNWGYSIGEEVSHFVY